MLIIGIHGKKQSGKDSVLDAIRSYYHNKTVQRIAFADKVKLEVSVGCGVSVEYMEAHKEVFRPMYQWWGTDFRRNLFSKEYWLHKWLDKLNESTADIVVAPDVRFLNETFLIKNKKGFVWKVTRKEFELGGHKEVLTGKSTDTHASETELDNHTNFDTYITNGGTLMNLERDVHLQLQMLKYKL